VVFIKACIKKKEIVFLESIQIRVVLLLKSKKIKIILLSKYKLLPKIPRNRSDDFSAGMDFLISVGAKGIEKTVLEKLGSWFYRIAS
jgi:hypothetical protein